jgi:hypothetical protein
MSKTMHPAHTHYFIGDGPVATALINRASSIARAHMHRCHALKDQHGADALVLTPAGALESLAFEVEHRADRVVRRPGLRLVRRESSDGGHFHVYAPDVRTEEGQRLASAFRALGAVNFSNTVLDQLGAQRQTTSGGTPKPTACVLRCSVAGTRDGRLFMTVPVDPADPFNPPAWLRAVPQADYCAALA